MGSQGQPMLIRTLGHSIQVADQLSEEDTMLLMRHVRGGVRGDIKFMGKAEEALVL